MKKKHRTNITLEEFVDSLIKEGYFDVWIEERKNITEEGAFRERLIKFLEKQPFKTK
jgi:hypothetical protein